MNYSHLKEIQEPLYDTLIVNGCPSSQYTLFCKALGQSGDYGTKTLKDTNMLCGGMLSYPITGRWSWMRFIFTDWCHVADVHEVMTNASVEFLVANVPIVKKSLSVFEPIFPRGGEKVMKEWLAKKEIDFWPWLETAIPKIEVAPTETFMASVNFMNPNRLHGPLLAKVVLGPTLLVPDEYRQIHPEDRDAMMGPDFGDPVDPT